LLMVFFWEKKVFGLGADWPTGWCLPLVGDSEKVATTAIGGRGHGDVWLLA